VFLSAPIFVWKIYPQNSYLANLPCGGKIKNADRFFKSDKNSVRFFLQNRFTSAFSLLFATATITTATAATRPLKRKKLPFRSCKRLREMVYYQ